MTPPCNRSRPENWIWKPKWIPACLPKWLTTISAQCQWDSVIKKSLFSRKVETSMILFRVWYLQVSLLRMDNLSYQIVYDKSSFIFGLAEQDSLMCQNIVQTERLHLVFYLLSVGNKYKFSWKLKHFLITCPLSSVTLMFVWGLWE